MELAAKLATWKASWLAVIGPLTLLGLATLPQGKVFLTYVPPGSLGGWTLSWVKAEASQTITKPTCGINPRCGDGRLIVRHKYLAYRPQEHLLFLFPCFDMSHFSVYCLAFCFCDGSCCVSFHLGT